MKSRGAEFVMDTTPFSYIMKAYNCKGPNWILLLLDVEERFGFSLRLSVQLGCRLVAITPQDSSRQWYNKNWLELLFKNGSSTVDQVLFYCYSYI
jgi:hypothetical protein